MTYRRKASTKPKPGSRVQAEAAQPRFESDFRFAISEPAFAGGSSGDLTRAVISGLADSRRNAVRFHLKRAARIEALGTRRNQELNKLLGNGTRQRFLNFSRQQRESVYGITDFRPGHFNGAVLQEAKEAARKRSRDMLRRARVDTGANMETSYELQEVHII